MNSEIHMQMNGEIRKGMQKELKKAIEDVSMKRIELLKKDPNSSKLRFVDSFFGMGCVEITKQNDKKIPFKQTYEIHKGYLEFDEYNGKYEDTELFAQFVAPYLKPQDIVFTSTECFNQEDKWGFRIRQDSFVVELEYNAQETDIIYYPLTPCEHKHTSLMNNSTKNIIPNSTFDIEFERRCDYCGKSMGFERQFFKFEKTEK